MQRYKNEKKTFDPIYSDKILQIAILYRTGNEVFGDKANFDTWLETKNVALGGVKPKELLDNTFGISLVRDELGRIENGVLA
jgi:putative toxin-antitoxin system antitoxin component (TIGR02293 family)